MTFNINIKIIILIFFILLNVFDFINFLSADLNFFKKILSWLLIGYLFYSISITKILFGKREKFFDFILVIGFSFMSIIKSFFFYSSFFLSNIDNFLIFRFLENIYSLNPNIIVNLFFILGIFLLIIISINFCLNSKIYENSLINSFNLNKNTPLCRVKIFLISFTFLNFFSITIFNFFMEWFALAIDSIILSLGLIYYTYIFTIHFFKNRNEGISNKLTSNKIYSLTQKISNSGNNFFKMIIISFSNKKTFLIGVLFVFCVHLFVDFCVFIIPYFLGIQNSLYFNPSIIIQNPLLTFPLSQNFTNSILYFDIKNFGILYLPILIFFYLIFLFSISFLLIVPSIYFYKKFNQKKFTINKKILSLFLLSIFISISFNFNSNLNEPIKISNLYGNDNINQNVYGINYKTNQIYKSENSKKSILIILILSISLYFIILYLIQINLFYEKFFNLTKIIFLSFFILFILVFSYSLVFTQTNDIIKEILNKNYLDKKILEFNEIKNFEENNKNKALKIGKISDYELYIFQKENFDIIKFKLDNPNQKKSILVFNNIDEVILESRNQIKFKKYFIENGKSNEIFYIKTKNVFFVNQNSKIISVKKTIPKLDEKFINLEKIPIIEKIYFFNKIYINLFLVVFYIFGFYYFFRVIYILFRNNEV